MSAHTPGPWTVSSIGGGFEVEAADGTIVAQALQTDPPTNPFRHQVRKANSRLIAAAPELLEALKALSGHVVWAVTHCHGAKCRDSHCAACMGDDYAEKYVQNVRDAHATALAAIAKAEGR